MYKYPALRRRLRRVEEHMYGLQQNPNLSTEDLRRRTSRVPMPSADVYAMRDLRSARSGQHRLTPESSPPDMPPADPYPAHDVYDPYSPRSDDALLYETHAWGRAPPAIRVSSDDGADMDVDIADDRHEHRRAPDTALPWPDVPDVHRRTTYWRNVSS